MSYNKPQVTFARYIIDKAKRLLLPQILLGSFFYIYAAVKGYMHTYTFDLFMPQHFYAGIMNAWFLLVMFVVTILAFIYRKYFIGSYFLQVFFCCCNLTSCCLGSNNARSFFWIVCIYQPCSYGLAVLCDGILFKETACFTDNKKIGICLPHINIDNIRCCPNKCTCQDVCKRIWQYSSFHIYIAGNFLCCFKDIATN